MFEKALILGLYSVTPVHAGSGAELSVIDLPIQRERHTGFPVIWGQSLKGVLRNAFKNFELKEIVGDKTLREKLMEELAKIEEELKKIENDEQRKTLERRRSEIESILKSPPKTTVIFGPDTDKAHEHAGAISVGDAKILLFPVRSLKGVFAYVTCPLVLERFKKDLELCGIDFNFDISIAEEDAIVTPSNSIAVDDKIIIEDIVLNAKEQDISSFTKIVSKISPISIDESRIAIVHDNIFTNLVQMATEIVARVQIDASTGTVKSGALWYEEYLPSDTLLYSIIAIGKPKRPIDGLSTANEISNEIKIFEGKFVQIGGNETVGKGFVRLKVMCNEDKRAE